MHFRKFSYHQKLFLQKRYFLLSGVVKNVFYAFAHTSRPPETFSRKDIFDRLEWLKMFFHTFAHTSIPPKTFLSKKIFLTVWSG
jgi:hypothetical protein